MIRQFVILFGCLALGELLVAVTNSKFPSSIIGLLLLTLFLKLGWVKLHWVKNVSDLLVKNLAFFFVPAGVAIMLHLDLIKSNLQPIIFSTVISTIIVLVVTGRVHQILRKNK